MKLHTILFCMLLLGFCTICVAQTTNWKPNFYGVDSSEDYKQGAAIFLNDVIVSNVFRDNPNCILGYDVKGYITVYETANDKNGAASLDKLDFQVAIFNKRTETIRMFSTDVFQYIKWETIIPECEEGDQVIIMTVDKKYKMPYHKISLMGGC